MNLVDLRHRRIGDAEAYLRFERNAMRNAEPAITGRNDHLEKARALQRGDRGGGITSACVILDGERCDLRIKHALQLCDKTLMFGGKAVRRESASQKRRERFGSGVHKAFL